MHERRVGSVTVLWPDTPEEGAALPGYGVSTDPETLRSAAAIEVAAERRIAAERTQADSRTS